MDTIAAEDRELEMLSRCLLCDGTRILCVDKDYNLSRCGACGYIFDNPRPTLEAIVAFYSAPRKYDDWLAVEDSREQLWKRRLKKLLPRAGRGRLLDVGAGIGQFLRIARPYFKEVSGTEVSSTAVRIARERYGLDIFQEQVENCNLPTNSFDTVTLFHVLEHVPDPKKTMERCKELLGVGGILLICVPNDVLAWTSRIKVIGKKLGFRAFRKFSPKFGIPRVFTSNEIHLSHFTPQVLRRLLGQLGLEVIEESIDPYYAYTGAKQHLHAAYYALHRLIFGLTGINGYDTIWMVARKVNS